MQFLFPLFSMAVFKGVTSIGFRGLILARGHPSSGVGARLEWEKA